MNILKEYAQRRPIQKKILCCSRQGEETFTCSACTIHTQGLEVRLIHAKEPGPAFREDFDKYPILYDGLERVLCPRVHFKMLIFDCEEAYIGSANLTGAGMGMKSENRRNFEAGILTDNPKIVEAAMEEFDKVWRGEMCKKCQRKTFCLDKIVT